MMIMAPEVFHCEYDYNLRLTEIYFSHYCFKANQKQDFEEKTKTYKHLISFCLTGPSMTLALLSWTFCTAMLQTLVPMNVGQQISRVLIPLPAHLLALRNLVLF